MDHIFTRAEYMNHDCTHRKYYGQFVTDSILSYIKVIIGERALLESKDEHLNDIKIKLWDDMHYSIRNMVNQKKWVKATGTSGFSLSDTVCIAKTAGHLIIDSARLASPSR
jgi:hypothetical protein